MKNLKTSFSTGALYPLESPRALRLVAEAGFQHAELMPQCFADLDKANYKEMLGAGVHIASVHYPLAMFAMLYSAHGTMSEEGRRFSRILVDFAHAMGSEVVIVHPTLEYEGDMKRLLEPKVKENIVFLADLCEKRSLTLAMENHPSGVGRLPGTLEAYVQSWGLASMRPMVDTTEALEGGVDPCDFIAGMAGVPCHLHLSDFAEGKKHLPIGTGRIDWKALAALLKGRGYEGYWTIEPSYKYYLEGIEARLVRDLERLEALL